MSRGARTPPEAMARAVAEYVSGRSMAEAAAAAGLPYCTAYRAVAAAVPAAVRRARVAAAVSASIRRRYAAGWRPPREACVRGGRVSAAIGRPGRPVWTDRPGEHWPNLTEAAAAVGVPRATLAAALEDARDCAGRQWYEADDRPQWARDAEAAARADVERAAAGRLAAVVVGGCVAGLPDGWKGCEQRWSEREVVKA